MNDYYVYCHLRLDNEQPFYIGKGRKGRCYEISRRSQFWKNIYNKYGRKVIFINENLTNEEAIQFEKFYINKYGRIDNGTGILCNLTDGGDGTPGCKRDNDGNKNPMYSKKHTDQTKKIISDKAKDRLKDKTLHPMYGKKFDEKSIELKSKSMKKWLEENVSSRTGKKNTKEHIDKYKKTVKERGSHSMGNNSKSIRFIFEDKIYSCFKELWLEKYNHMDYRYWLQKFDRTKIIII
jgi:hypothetical protein